MKKLKGIGIIALVCVVVIALTSRVAVLRKLVYGA